MYKRATSISINTIIVAIIALVVLVILIAVFTGQVSIFSSNTETCYGKGGTCQSAMTDKKCEEQTVVMFTKDCDFVTDSQENEDKLGQCCVPIR